MNKEQAIEKIKKCLRLAKSANENEAAQAFKHAQALMREFGVTDIDVEMSEIIETSVKIPVAIPKWQFVLFEICKDAFGVDGYIYRSLGAGTGNQMAHFRFYGMSPKPELAAYAYEVLLRQLRAARREYIATKLKRVKLAKNKTYRADEFCLGWVSTVYLKVEKFAVGEEEQQKLGIYLNRLNLTSTSKPRTINASSSAKRAGYDDYAEGYDKGKDAQLNHAMSGAESKRLGGIQP
ncbi:MULTISPECIES: DUF2786 domain-containing protein [Snodgrassella]|uniref:DUF2786 domain-containing protein n=1 Tax=Snodgrassella TaxID=1193515 RepID=UPI0008160E8B|nr:MULTISPECIES: DUF2786 domain-containing protein [Snodgrassella]SCC13003.1 Protein of unknown function [Snodgrassella sp. R-53583]